MPCGTVRSPKRSRARFKTRIELKQIQRDLGITFIFVTHDQEEALTLSDRIAVFHDGRIVQLGTPQDLYERPASRFVAVNTIACLSATSRRM